ncbi:MAG: hypothetical protein HY319_16365 [Armatimonadetes bacterium]|nr:hypothetical protein [Armatimonadota bacterium]
MASRAEESEQPSATDEYIGSVREHVRRDGWGNVLLDAGSEATIMLMLGLVAGKLAASVLPEPAGSVVRLALPSLAAGVGFLHGLSGGYTDQTGPDT